MVRGRPRKFDADEALEAAMQVFWKRGYESASTKELMDAMGINAGSMYSTFGDKDALFEKAFAHYERTVFSKASALLKSDGSPLERVRTLVGCWAEFMAHPDCKGCLVSHTVSEFGGSDHKVAKRARRLVTSIQKQFAVVIAEAMDAGELPKETDPAAMAAFLTSTAQGLTVMARAGAGADSIRGVVSTTLAVLEPAK